MDLTLTLTTPDFAGKDLQRLSLDLAHSLARDGGITAETVEGSALPSTRGDAITLGVLALSFLTSGAAVALLNVFKSYFERSAAMTVELLRADGAKLTVAAADLGAGRFEQTLALAQQLLAPEKR
jgi:hypothetical protein